MKKAIKITNHLSTENLYRLPWTMTDNATTWLEVTRACDITCEYCPQDKSKCKHKSLREVSFEIDELMKMRKCSTMIIAGGEPLVHPELLEIVALIKKKNVQAFIITNGVTLDATYLSKLKKSGLMGAILHVDSGQHRPDWENKTEGELNELRQYFADMFHAEKDMICSFITTVIPAALSGVPDIIKWMNENTKKVNQNILIPVREWHLYNHWDSFVDGKQVNAPVVNNDLAEFPKYISAGDISDEIRKSLPDFNFNSYLGGTEIANAPKWAIGSYLQLGDKFLGSIGPKSMEIIQNAHHFINGTYFSFSKKRTYGMFKFLLPLLSLFDKEARAIFVKYFLLRPWNFFLRSQFQTIVVMQPWDFTEEGEYDMCDGCPNKTYYKGRLVSECRIDEYSEHGKLLSHGPRRCK